MFREIDTFGALTPDILLDSAMTRELSGPGLLKESVVDGIVDSFGLGTAARYIDTFGSADFSKRLTEDEYRNSQFFRPEISFDPRMTEDRIAALAAWHDARQVRKQRLSNASSTFLSLTGNIAGQALDPINYIPFVGPAARGVAVGRFGVVGGRAATGALDAALNTAAFGALTADLRSNLGDNVTLEDYLFEIATAAMIGAAFGTGAGAIEARGIRRRAAAVRQAVDTHAALNEAVGSLAVDGEVRISEPAVQSIETVARKETPDNATLDNFEFAPVAVEDLTLPAERLDPAPADPNVAPAAAAPEPTLKSEAQRVEDLTSPEITRLVEDGETVRNGRPEPFLQAAQMVHDQGGLQTKAEIEAFAEDFAKIERTDNPAPNIRELVRKHSPTGRAQPRPNPTPKTDASPAPAEAADPAVKEAEARVGRPDPSIKELSDEFDIDAEAGTFPELDEIALLEAQDRLSTEEKLRIDQAAEIVKRTDAFNDALRQAAICEMA